MIYYTIILLCILVISKLIRCSAGHVSYIDAEADGFLFPKS